MAKYFLTVPAIRISQPIGEFFLCSIPAETLLAVTYSIPATAKRSEGLLTGIFGNQRTEIKDRSRQIGAYIDEENSTFPNNIILSANYRTSGDFEDDESLQWRVERVKDEHYQLIVPSPERLASIIDGQHRLKGFEESQKPDRKKMDMPCAVFINLPRPYQARIFATININQKRVDKSLAYQLFGYDLNEKDADLWSPDMLAVFLARNLEGRDDSPFKNHVRLALVQIPGEGKQSSVWKVSIASIVEGITRLISAKPAADRSALLSKEAVDRSKLAIDSTPLRQWYIDGKDKKILELIIDYFRIIDEVVWSHQTEGSFATKTVGILALFDILREGLSKKRLDPNATQQTTRTLFAHARGINFSDDFFHASGAGRVRIRRVLQTLTGLDPTPQRETAEAVSRLLHK